MENKYYTPSIEEFHVGFEYEQLELDSIFDNYWRFKIKKQIFNEKISKSLYNIVVLEDDIKENKIRVKYLDKEDIESLGFTNDEYNGVKCFKKNIYKLFWFENSNKIVSIDCLLNNNEKSIQLFRGIIKNKSELKQVLKMLNIK